MFKSVTQYFSEFKILKSASKDFWLTNILQFFDNLSYFSMITVLALYLTTNCGFNDVDSGAWVGIYTLYITAFVFAVGSICDVLGIRRSFYIGIGLLALSRLGMGLAPEFLTGPALGYTVKGMIIVMALGTAAMGPVVMTCLRRFTSKKTRATGFNINYLFMNICAVCANALIVDGFRNGFPKLANLLGGVLPAAAANGIANGFGEVRGNLAIFIFGFAMALLSMLCVRLIREDNFAEETERIEKTDAVRRPLNIFMEVWKERAFQKLLMFLVLTIGVRLVFTHQFLVMPKYYTRVLYTDFELGLANSLNPFIIVLGLILLIPILNRFATVNLIIIGMAISAASLIVMAVPLDWVMTIPGIDNITQAYFFIIITQITMFAAGELIFSPRFTQYIASVSPPDKVSSYMALSALPNFIAKPINGFVSGILISKFCYDGIRPKIETGNIEYTDSPEFMWMIYLLLAIMSPFAVIAMRRFLTSTDTPAAAATPEGEAS